MNNRIHSSITSPLFALGYRMDTIPVKFEYEGDIFQGKLQKVTGENGSVWYNLYIDEYLYGQLFNTEERGWVFQSNRGLFEEQQYVDIFLSAIQAWNN